MAAKSAHQGLWLNFLRPVIRALWFPLANCEYVYWFPTNGSAASNRIRNILRHFEPLKFNKENFVLF